MRPLTLADIFDTKALNNAQVSPDGKQVAFVVADAYKEGTAQIWMASVASSDGSDCRAFTGGKHDRHPRWSPDGDWLAFLSDRQNDDGRNELFVISRHGGEARRVFEAKSSVGGDGRGELFAWSPDGKTIACLMEDPETEEEKKLKDEKIDPLLFERDHKFMRVWVADVTSGELRCVTTEPAQVWEFSWSADGSQFGLIVSDEPYEWSWYHCKLATVPAAGGSINIIYDPSPRQAALPRWSPDGTQLAFLQSIWSDRGSVGGDLNLIPAGASGGVARSLTTEHPASVTWMAWMPDGGSLITLATAKDGVTVEEWEAGSGASRKLWAGPASIADPFWNTFSHDRAFRSLAFARESADSPRQIWLARRDHDSLTWTQLTHFHADKAEATPVQSRSITWTGADGWEMQGFLLLPDGYEAGKSYPLFTWVHGGPTSLFTHRYWSAMPQAHFAARGIAVFLPNPRGSTGRGLKFAEANVGDMGGQDFHDIMAGIESLIQQGLADPDKLAIGGWSYGGFMTAWAVTQTDRFKAAVMGAGIVNWLSFHGTSKLCEWDRIHYNTDPYEPRSKFEQFSAINLVGRVRTPTLIVHGEKDRDVPVSQGYEFFRALKQHGVPTELRVYPRQAHGFSEKAHQRDWVEYAAKWLERWLGLEVGG
ncbi:MAG: S9 family peptidase [Chloroflexi bacterium]|nr:S9 family peptidase [Chloroflexota bacterium]